MLQKDKKARGRFLEELQSDAPPLTPLQEEIKLKKSAKKADAIKFASAVIAFSMVVLTCIFFTTTAPLYFLILSLVGFGGLGVAIAFINPKKREGIFKLLFVILAGAAAIFLIYIILRQTGIMNSLEDAEVIAAFIRRTGIWGVLVFIVFIILNTIFLPVPLAVPAVIGAIVFGPLLSFVYMSIGTVLGSIIVFVLGKRFGKRLVVWMIGKEKTEKYATLLDKKGRLAFVFMMIFPFFPDDILCLVAGMSNMSYKFFLLVICPIRIGVLAFTAFFASGSIIPFSGWGIYVWIALAAVFIGGAVIFALVKRKRKKALK